MQVLSNLKSAVTCWVQIYKIMIRFWKSACSVVLEEVHVQKFEIFQKSYSKRCLKCKEIHYHQLVSSFPHGLPFPSAELLPAAAWPDEISVRPGCSLCQCSAYPANTHKQKYTKSIHLEYFVINTTYMKTRDTNKHADLIQNPSVFI